MSRRIHHRTEQIGLRLVHHLAPAVVAALDDIRRQQWQCDGWPTRGDSPGRGSSDTSTTESAALQAGSYGRRVEEIIDVIDSIEISVGRLAEMVIGIDRTPAAADMLRCHDGQKGRDALLWSDDQECVELATKLGLCNRHYFQYYRYRVAHRLPVGQYFEPSV